MHRFIKIFFLFVFSFLIARNVLAVSQIDYSQSNNWGWNNLSSIQTFCQSFKADTEIIEKVNLYLGRNSSCPDSPYELTVFIDDNLAQGIGSALQYTKISKSECESLLPLSSSNVVEISFNSPVSLTVDNTYYICVYSGNFSLSNWGIFNSSVSSVYSDGILYPYKSSEGGFYASSLDLYFETFEPVPTWTIDDPLDDSFLSIGSYEFSGTCGNNGEDQLYLGWKNWDIFDSWYDVDCVSSTWSKIVEIPEGKFNWYLVDKDESVEDMPIISTYGLTDDPLENYFLSIIYPEDNEQHYFLRQDSDNVEFTFSYSLPFPDLATSTIFQILKYDESFWGGDFTYLYNNSLEFYDPDLLSRFTLDDFIASTTAVIFYEAKLYDNDDNLKYNLKFRVDGNGNDSSPSENAPALDDYGFLGNLLRSLFVPNRRFLIDYVDDIPLKLATVVPFCYYYQLTGELENYSVDSASSTILSFNVNVDNSNLDISFFDSSLEPVQEFANGIRPYFSLALWIFLLIYIVHRVMDFEI